jgi:hypothetical protein
MEVVTLSEVTQGLALLQVQGDVEAGLKLVGGGYSGQLYITKRPWTSWRLPSSNAGPPGKQTGPILPRQRHRAVRQTPVSCSSRNPMRSRLNSSGFSTWGVWPQSGMTSSR